MKKSTLIVIAIAVLFLIGGVVFFGYLALLDPGSIDYWKCSIPQDFWCEDFMIETDSIWLAIRSRLNHILLKKIVFTETSEPTHHICETSEEITIPPGRAVIIQADSCSIQDVKEGQIHRYSITYTYQIPPNKSVHSGNGELSGKVALMDPQIRAELESS